MNWIEILSRLLWSIAMVRKEKHGNKKIGITTSAVSSRLVIAKHNIRGYFITDCLNKAQPIIRVSKIHAHPVGMKCVKISSYFDYWYLIIIWLEIRKWKNAPTYMRNNLFILSTEESKLDNGNKGCPDLKVWKLF